MAKKAGIKKQNKLKKERLCYLVVYFLFSCVAIYFLRPYYFFSILFVLVPPSIVNFLWLKKSRTKIIIFSLLSTVLFAPPIELITRIVNAWDVQSIFPRPFGLIPLENMLFAFLNFFWVLCFYEYFIDRDTTKKISSKIKYLVWLYLLLSAIVFSLFFIYKGALGLSYVMVSVPVLIVPSILIFHKNPRLIKKTILPTLFFAFIFFVYEFVSLQINNWWWPGEYIYTFSIGGKILPFDDIVIWYLLSTPTLIGGYEFFADDFR